MKITLTIAIISVLLNFVQCDWTLYGKNLHNTRYDSDNQYLFARMAPRFLFN